MDTPRNPVASPSPRRMRWVWWAVAAIAAYGLLAAYREHPAEAVGWLAFWLLLPCPLTQVFMHGGPGRAMHPVPILAHAPQASFAEHERLARFGPEHASHLREVPAFMPHKHGPAGSMRAGC